jgi:hypothetical protein
MLASPAAEVAHLAEAFNKMLSVERRYCLSNETGQLIPQSIPQCFQTRPAPANATNPIDPARSRYTSSAPTLPEAANAQINGL